MIINKIFFLLFLFVCFPVQAFIGSIDKREYVNWADYPQIVYFSNGCTAQYVAQDIILTAAHCLNYWGGDYEKNEHVYYTDYEILLYDGRKASVVLEKVGPYYSKDGRYSIIQEWADYAFLRVRDPEFYSDKFYNLAETAQKVSIENLGFGKLRVMTDYELSLIKDVWNDVIREYNTKYESGYHRALDLNELMDMFSEKLKSKNILPLKETTARLKKSKCSLFDYASASAMKVRLSPKYGDKPVLFATCDISNGNSGGAAVRSGEVLAITVIGTNTMVDMLSYGVYVTADSMFADFKSMPKNFDSRGNVLVADDLPSIEGRAETVDAGLLVGTDKYLSLADTTVRDDESPSLIFLQNQIEENRSVISRGIEKNDKMTDSEFFKFLDAWVEYEDLSEQYEAAKAKEQSLANRLLGAAAMGAGGIGGMMLASDLAEQKADKDAELDMTAYLATFRCDYGAGRNIKGGETNIELPGASELIPLYSEYVALANDLKSRKAQLGLNSGIESENILDAATTGLYDDVSTGITSGAYASLARALQNPDGEDAKKWAEQKEENAKKIKTGATVGGIGVIGGAVGNVIINKDTKSKN